MLILHYTGLPAAAALRRLCDSKAKVSAHYLVDETGAVLRLVAEEARAWHAGVSFWAGESDINACSVGVEIVNGGHAFGLPDFPEAQMRALEILCPAIVARWRIAPRFVLAHSDIAPARKKDPGEKFNWARLARARAGLWAEPAPPGEILLAPGAAGEPVRALQSDLARFGYGELARDGDYGEQTRLFLAAFQRHFRPARADGLADRSTLGQLAALLALA